MPLVRIDVPGGTTDDYRRAIGDVVYAALTEVMKAPQNDRFQIIAEHAPANLIIDPTYLNIQRSPAAIVIQVTLNEGRSVELKKAFYQAIADGLQARIGLRREDVFISLVEVKKENWSFGNGEAQYAT
jgi:phenylpyruvate tautomerase PptA (4-oxalocrotonate tautomerase family)